MEVSQDELTRQKKLVCERMSWWTWLEILILGGDWDWCVWLESKKYPDTQDYYKYFGKHGRVNY